MSIESKLVGFNMFPLLIKRQHYKNNIFFVTNEKEEKKGEPLMLTL
jgi:hypothetical protein